MPKVIRPEAGFGWCPNSIINNPALSAKAKGLWLYINSKPADWSITVRGIASQMKDGMDSVSAGIKELEDAGLLTRIKKNTPKGFTTEYILSTEPAAESPCGEIPRGETPRVSNKEKVKQNKVKKNKKTIGNKLPIGQQADETAIQVIPDNGLKTFDDGSIDHRNDGIERAFDLWEEIVGSPQKRNDAKNRRAAYNILRAKDKGRDWLEKMLRGVAMAESDRYSRLYINNFADLQAKWEELLAWGRRKAKQQAVDLATNSNLSTPDEEGGYDYDQF